MSVVNTEINKPGDTGADSSNGSFDTSQSYPNSKDDDKKKKRSTKGRVFQCTGFPGCSMSFTRSEHLARHKRKHTGERPFTCPYCLKNFSRLDNLRQHKQTVHAYENYLATKKEKENVIESKDEEGHIHPQYYNPGTPNHMPLVSPPNSHSPQNHPYFKYLVRYYDKPYDGFVPHPNAQIVQNPQNGQNPQNPQNPPNPQAPQNGHIAQNGPQNGSQNPQPQNQQPLQSAPPHHTQHPQHTHADPGIKNGASLKLPAHQFKPKRRPRPLSLQHSFVLNSDKILSSISSFSSSGSSTAHTPLYSQYGEAPGLKSAPLVPLYLFNQYLSQQPPPVDHSVLVGPKLALLTPNVISPISPLHHFHQQNGTNKSHLPPIRQIYSPTYQNFQFPGNGPAPATGSNLSLVLPPMQHLTRPTHHRNAHSLNSIIQDEMSTTHTTPIKADSKSDSGKELNELSKDNLSEGSKEIKDSKDSLKENSKESTKNWLRGVLNDEQEVKKPTINSLLASSKDD